MLDRSSADVFKLVGGSVLYQRQYDWPGSFGVVLNGLREFIPGPEVLLTMLPDVA